MKTQRTEMERAMNETAEMNEKNRKMVEQVEEMVMKADELTKRLEEQSKERASGATNVVWPAPGFAARAGAKHAPGPYSGPLDIKPTDTSRACARAEVHHRERKGD